MPSPDTHTTLSTYVNKSISKQINSIASELDRSTSQLVKDAVYTFIANHDEVNTENYPEFEKVIKNMDRFDKNRINKHYMELEHMTVETDLKALTFFDYMDKNMAEIVRRNNTHMSDEKLEDILEAHLETYKYRVEEHDDEHDSIDFQKRYEWRKDDPMKFANDKLEQLAKERKNEG